MRRQAGVVRKNKKSPGVSKSSGKARTYRKGRKSARASNATKILTTTSTSGKKRDKSFPFLDLPAELRNNIYEIVLQEEPKAYLSKRTGSTLVSQSSLARVNRQVRNEFLSVVYLCAGQITASVKDFDFRHIVTFLNRLSDKEMTALIETPTTRNLRIELTFTSKFSGDHYSGDFSLLDRWVRRLEHPTKRGTNIDASYHVVEHGSFLRYPMLSNTVTRRWYKQGRQDEEAKKIGEAMRSFDQRPEQVALRREAYRNASVFYRYNYSFNS